MEKIYTVEVYNNVEEHNGYNHCIYSGQDKAKALKQYEVSQEDAERELQSEHYKYGESVDIIFRTCEYNSDEELDCEVTTVEKGRRL